MVGNWSADKDDYSTTAEADALYRAESWDNFTGIPHATPSNGDQTHFSWADEIYDWVIGLNYITKEVGDLTNYYLKTETYTKAEVDNNLSLQDECSEITNCVPDAWDANADIDANEISESKIDMDTSCGAGNHLYVDGDNFACEADDDTTYSAGANLSLDGTTFSLDATSVKSWLDTIYQAIGNYLTTSTEFGGEVSGTYDAIVLDDDALDDQYYDSESDLTGLLDDNYEPISAAHFDATTLNITCLDAECNWFTNASDSCMYWPSGGKDCGAA